MVKDITPFTITPSEKYPRSELHVETWKCKELEIVNRRKQEIKIIDDRPKSLRIKFNNGVQEEHWIPKSVCKIIQRMEKGLMGF